MGLVSCTRGKPKNMGNLAFSYKSCILFHTWSVTTCAFWTVPNICGMGFAGKLKGAPPFLGVVPIYTPWRVDVNFVFVSLFRHVSWG